MINLKIVDNRHWRTTYMNSDYKVGDLIYDANIYDAMNTNLDDLYFYKRWLPKNKDARILELCCGTGRLTLPIAKEGYDITGVDYTPSMLAQAKMKASEAGLEISFIEADIRTLNLRKNTTLSLFHLIRFIIYIRMKIYLRYLASLRITSKTAAYFCLIVLIRISNI